MSGAPSTINVTELIDQRRVTELQIRVVILCALTIFLDGIDTIVIGLAAPSLAAAIGVSVTTFGPVFGIGQAGILIGVLTFGPLGDRFGRKIVIWFSIVGALPFTLALPHVGLYASAALTIIIGLVISSTTSSIIVFAQELVPHRFGMISGVFFGVAFGIGGLGAAALGKLADHTSIEFVYQVCAYLPAIGLLAVFLPSMKPSRV